MIAVAAPVAGRPFSMREDERQSRVQAEVYADTAEARNTELEEELAGCGATDGQDHAVHSDST